MNRRLLVARSVEEIGPIIQAELAAQRRTQAWMSRDLGFTEKHVSFMLTGKNRISLPNLFAMCDFLNVAIVVDPSNE